MAAEWTAAEIPDQSGRTAVVTGASSGLEQLTGVRYEFPVGAVA